MALRKVWRSHWPRAVLGHSACDTLGFGWHTSASAFLLLCRGSVSKEGHGGTRPPWIPSPPKPGKSTLLDLRHSLVVWALSVTKCSLTEHDLPLAGF